MCITYICFYFRHGIDKLPKTELVMLFVSWASFVMVCYVTLGTNESLLFSVKNDLLMIFFFLFREIFVNLIL